MPDEIQELYCVPEIITDGIANLRVINTNLHFHYWAWQMSPCGVLQKVLVGRLRMGLAGVHAARPLITAALQGQEPSLYQYPEREGDTAH